MIASLFCAAFAASFLFQLAAAAPAKETFLDINVDELCASEPHLELCRKRAKPSRSCCRRHDPIGDRLFPGASPKDATYCKRLRPSFAWTCMPSKPLRLDLVEFCKDYSSICHMPNYHQLPGPRQGGARPNGFGYGGGAGGVGGGNVGVSGNFNFGIGAVPGLEVNAGWGVDVGPIPGMGDSVGVNTGLGLGVMGAASSPEAFRRGMSEGAASPGLVGVNSGFGVGR